METAEQNTKQAMEENEALKQLIELFSQQDMDRQSQDFAGILWYMTGMQMQLTVMVDELQGVREQLSQMQENQPRSVTEKLTNKVTRLQEKTTSLSECLSLVKNSLVEIAQQTASASKERRKAEMCKVLQTGISGVKSALSDYRKRLVDTITDCEKTVNQIDSIGDELKQIGNSASNVGRLLAGKGTKEVSDEESGVGMTRVINKPAKKTVESLRKKIDGIDKASEKLDRLSSSLDAGKEVEKGGWVSVKDKLSQMKEKTGRKKAPGQDKVKTKSKEECL